MSVNNTDSSIYVFSTYFSLTTAIVLTIVGIIGNLIVIFVFTRKNFRSIPMFNYYSIAILFETLQILPLLPYNFPNYFLINENKFSCKFFQYYSYLTAQYTAWIGLVISIDRFISVKFSNKFAFRSKFSFQATVLAILFFISIAASFPHYQLNDIVPISNTTGYCGFNGNKFANIALDVTTLIINLFIPFVVGIIFSCLTYYQLRNNKIRFDMNKLNKERRLFKILVAMDLYFFLCYFSWFAYVISNDINVMFGVASNQLLILYNFAVFFYYIYDACNFFLHFLCNKQFRNYFLVMIKYKTNRVENIIS